jgi:anti-sigma28 factor (negative regulator of flagellin synthesis)
MAYNTKKMGRREKGIKRKRVLNLKKTIERGST